MAEPAIVADGAGASESKVRSLRRRWKPVKEGAASGPEYEAVRVRLHRCWSWQAQMEELVEDPDGRLICGWIALNGLYGVWDDERREPVADGQALDRFLRRLLASDRDGLVWALLTGERRLVSEIVGDPYLSRYYWKEPGETQARRAEGAVRKLGSLYFERRGAVILEMVLDRVYLARCQLVHGAATCGSELNRDAVSRCGMFLGLFLGCAGQVIVDHAWAEDWSGLCYPPVR